MSQSLTNDPSVTSDSGKMIVAHWMRQQNTSTIALLLAFAGSAATADADNVAPAETPNSPSVAVGYKIGNGLGFAGVDLIVSPFPHLQLELQGSWVTGTATGYGVAPSVVGKMMSQGNTPYLKAGLVYAELTVLGVTGSVTGAIVNLGYEWVWDSGLEIQLGGGIVNLGAVEIMGATMDVFVEEKDSLRANLEFGVRYRF